jgi:hypothetical protein
MRIYSLPPGCPELDTFKHLYFAAACRVMQELHDLEKACQESNVGKLLQLPQLALLHLLNNRQTRVASENTVIYVIQRWAVAQQQQPSLLEMQQLCSSIRMGSCSVLYLSTVLAAWPLLGQCFTPQEHALACMLASSNRATQQQKLPAILQAAEQLRVPNARMARLELQQTQMMLEGNSIIRSRPVWLQSARPEPDYAGAAKEYHVEFEIQVSWVEDLVNDALAKAHAAAAAVEGEEFEETVQWQVPSWKGRSYAFGLLAVASTAPTAPPAAAAAAPAAAPAVRRHAGEVRQAAAVAGGRQLQWANAQPFGAPVGALSFPNIPGGFPPPNLGGIGPMHGMMLGPIGMQMPMQQIGWRGPPALGFAPPPQVQAAAARWERAVAERFAAGVAAEERRMEEQLAGQAGGVPPPPPAALLPPPPAAAAPAAAAAAAAGEPQPAAAAAAADDDEMGQAAAVDAADAEGAGAAAAAAAADATPAGLRFSCTLKLSLGHGSDMPQVSHVSNGGGCDPAFQPHAALM